MTSRSWQYIPCHYVWEYTAKTYSLYDLWGTPPTPPQKKEFISFILIIFCLENVSNFRTVLYIINYVHFIFADKICDSETVGVYNSQNMIFPANGTEDFLTGRALLTEETGKLKLFLDGIPEGECKYMFN